MEVGRSLDSIDSKVKQLNSSLKLASDQTRELDKSLKLNPKNIDASTKKLELLKTQELQVIKEVEV